MAKGWIYALGWVVFGLYAAALLPHRVADLQTGLRDDIEDDLDSNGMTDFRVHMNGQAAVLSYRRDATPVENPRDRMIKAGTIAAAATGDLPRLGRAGGVIMGPVTMVRLDERSLSEVQARLDRAEAEAEASSASAASLAAAHTCTDEVTQAVAQRRLSFVTGSADLTGDSQAILTDIYNTARKCPEGLMLRVEGHTDNVGGVEDNMRLSSSRADAAAAALIRLGWPQTAVQSQGLGPKDPVADNMTDDGRARNRRVDFILEPQGG